MPTSERSGQRLIDGVFQECVELHEPLETQCGFGGALSRIDQVYTGGVRGSAAEWHTRGLSDDLPLMVRLGQRTPLSTSMPVTLAVLRKALCEEYMPAYVDVPAQGRSVSAVERWRDVNAAIRAVAEAARRKAAAADDTDVSTTDGVLRCMSRAVMRAQAWLVHRLLQHSMVARREIGVDGGRVFLRDCAGFAARLAAARIAALEASSREVRADGRKGRRRFRAIQRMLALWESRARRLGLLCTSCLSRMLAGRVAAFKERQTEADRYATLRAHWQTVFERQPMPDVARSLWVARPMQPWPQLHSAGASRCRQGRSPDAKGQCAWIRGIVLQSMAAGDEAAAVLHELMWEVFAGAPVPEYFAVALLHLSPKATSQERERRSSLRLGRRGHWAS